MEKLVKKKVYQIASVVSFGHGSLRKEIEKRRVFLEEKGEAEREEEKDRGEALPERKFETANQSP